jgi:hypothetical protein
VARYEPRTPARDVLVQTEVATPASGVSAQLPL